MFEVERNGNEVVVTHDDMFDVSTDLKTLVLSLKQARRLSEALLEETLTVSWDITEEDG